MSGEQKNKTNKNQNQTRQKKTKKNKKKIDDRCVKWKYATL